jgi:alkylated DNA nucleotide flippase Atl1
MTYGDVARHLGIPSARIVGQVLASSSGAVPWHRVVLSTGAVAPHLADRQLPLLAGEGVDVSSGRVALRRHRWRPGGD